jgi:hypothetical protein
MNNPYGSYMPNYNRPTIEQSLQQFSGLLNQYQQMQQPPQMSVQVPLSNQGRWYYVTDYNEVATTPTPQDGTASLFVNLDKGVLWSKKFVNGANSIQAFSIQPLNDFGGQAPQHQVQNIQVVEPQPSVTLEDVLGEIRNLSERVGKIEDAKYRKDSTSKSTNKTIDE